MLFIVLSYYMSWDYKLIVQKYGKLFHMGFIYELYLLVKTGIAKVLWESQKYVIQLIKLLISIWTQN